MKYSHLLAGIASVAFAAGAAQAAPAYTAPLTDPIPAFASADKTAFGAGSSLVSLFGRQAMDCYSQPLPLIFKNTPSNTLAAPNLFVFNSTLTPFNCNTNRYEPTQQVWYTSTGSGSGIRMVFGHDVTATGDLDPNTAGTQSYPDVTFGMSDASLGNTEVGYYNNGTAGATYQSLKISANATPGAGETVGNPLKLYGPLVQVPFQVATVAITYSPVYKRVRQGDGSIKEYKLNVYSGYKRADGSGGMHINQGLLCSIFNGTITNFNDAHFTAANNGISLKDPTDPAPFDAPIEVVGRSENSGTTAIFTRHMAALCSNETDNLFFNAADNQFNDAAEQLPTGLKGAYYNKSENNYTNLYTDTNYTTTTTNTPGSGKFTLANGSDGVAKYVAVSKPVGPTAGDTVLQARFGYVGTDFVLPYSGFNGNGFNLASADLRNKAGFYRGPNAAAGQAAFGAILPPQSNADGTYNAGITANGLRANPQDWVKPSSKFEADGVTPNLLANPSGNDSYPIIGTTNVMTYSCFADYTQANAIRGFLNKYYQEIVYNHQGVGLVVRSGFATLPANWKKAILESFIQSNNATLKKALAIGGVHTNGDANVANQNCNKTVHTDLIGG